MFTDPVTVNLTVGLANLGSGILGSTSSTQIDVTYNAFRTALAADATSANDNMAVSSLNAIGSANSFNMLINRTTDNPNGSGSATPYLDNNGSLNNSDIYLTTANAKAAGLLSANNAASDGSVRFATAFEPQFDYDRSNGIAAGQFDFLGIAIHEIGHALGFISGVDLLDFFAGQGTADQFFAVAPLDLFRYSVASMTHVTWGCATCGDIPVPAKY